MINNSCGRQKEAGLDEQVSVQGDDLTMLSDELIPDVPSDYSGLHPADALLLVSDARRLGLLEVYIIASSSSATALAGVVATRGSATTLAGVVATRGSATTLIGVFATSGSLVGIRGGAIP